MANTSKTVRTKKFKTSVVDGKKVKWCKDKSGEWVLYKPRSFTLVKAVMGGKTVQSDAGRYSGSSPVSAARKAASQVRRHTKEKGDVKVYIKETTRVSKKKPFGYHVKFKSNPKPKVPVKGRKEAIHFKYIVTATKVPPLKE